MNINTKNIEIEFRGPLSKDEFTKLDKFLKQEGHFKLNKERILIDYSTFISTEGLKGRVNDIRLRVTNKIPEIIVKIGKMSEAESRKEISILANRGDFDKLVQVFAALGFTKGMLCVRRSRVYMYKNIEFSLVEVPNHSFYFEAERLISSIRNKEQAQRDIRKVCKRLNLRLFNDKTLFSYIRKLNKEANEVFNFKNYKENYFKDRFCL